MTYAADDELRRELYIKFRSRGDKENEAVLRDISSCAPRKAGILGFRDWADYITADKMIQSGERASEFIEKVWKLAAPRSDEDYAELLRTLQRIDSKAREVADWQKVFLENLVKKERYEVDASEVRQYFPYERVLGGLLAITSEIFDITYAPVTDPQVWHPSVLVYDVCVPATSSAASTSTCIRARASTSTRHSSRSRTVCAACSCRRACCLQLPVQIRQQR
jgi:thimet oligopeptidase